MKRPSLPGPTSGKAAAKKPSTSIWGGEIEAGDYIKVPRAMLHVRQYVDTKKHDLQPRHLLLILGLAARKFQNKAIRVYWEELEHELGFKRHTIRKWAYELEAMGLLTIRRNRGRDPERNRVGIRNERNSFDLQPFVKLVESAFSQRKEGRDLRKAKRRKEA